MVLLWGIPDCKKLMRWEDGKDVFLFLMTVFMLLHKSSRMHWWAFLFSVSIISFQSAIG